jgi:hypothetical protein
MYSFTVFSSDNATIYHLPGASQSYQFGLTQQVLAATYTLTASTLPGVGGTTTGGGTFATFSSQTVTTTTNSNYTFNNWTLNTTVVSSDLSYTFTILSNVNLTANFTGHFNDLLSNGNGDGTINISGYTGSGGTVIIPTSLDGLPVTTIGNSAFNGS